MRLLLIAVAALWVGTSLAAKTFVYRCDIQVHSQGGGIPKTAAYLVNTDAETIMAIDGYIQRANGEPVETTILKFGPTVYEFKWKIALPSTSGSRVNVRYSAHLNINTNFFRLKAVSGDVRLRRGTGTCKIE